MQPKINSSIFPPFRNPDNLEYEITAGRDGSGANLVETLHFFLISSFAFGGQTTKFTTATIVATVASA